MTNAPEIARLQALIAERALEGMDTSSLQSAVRVLQAVDRIFSRPKAQPPRQADLFGGGKP